MTTPNRLLSAPEILEAQQILFDLALDPGPRDGVSGPGTAAAVRRFEAHRGWVVTGTLDLRLLEALRAQKGTPLPPPTASAPSSVVAPSSASTSPTYTYPSPSSSPSTSGVTTSRPTVDSTSEEMRTAQRAIRDAEHACPMLVAAQRVSDGSVRAACSNGEIYRVMKLRGEWIAMKCSAAERLGVTGC
jgi:peptidoglycan hydrolase-like protein with peptidoglycan-binding domain